MEKEKGKKKKSGPSSHFLLGTPKYHSCDNSMPHNCDVE